MGAALGFMGPFLEYLRPTKSPFLLVSVVCVVCIYAALSKSSDTELYRPEFFWVLYAVLLVVVPLSLTTQRHGPKVASSVPSTEGDAIPNTEDSRASDGNNNETLENSKFENDIESVFKFSRAACLAAGVLMLFYFFAYRKDWNFFSALGYTIVIIQIVTFMMFSVLRHIFGEDLSNVNLFQIAFMTATVFSGGTYASLNVNSIGSEPFFSCIEYKIDTSQGVKSSPCYYEGIIRNSDEENEVKSRNNKSNDLALEKLTAGDILSIEAIFRPDFRQISCIFLLFCWSVYETFWIITLVKVVRGRRGSLEPAAA